MADSRDGPRTSAPDLEILGDQVTLHPSGYVEPPMRAHDGDKERNLVEHMARFRSSPLEYVCHVFECVVRRLIDPATDSSEKYPSTSLAQDGGPTITSSGNRYSIPASLRT